MEDLKKKNIYTCLLCTPFGIYYQSFTLKAKNENNALKRAKNFFKKSHYGKFIIIIFGEPRVLPNNYKVVF